MRWWIVIVGLLLSTDVAFALTQAEVDSIIREVDARQSNVGDWKARIYIEHKEKNQNDTVYDGVSYRRDADDKMMLLFLRPKSESGKGYLKIGKNMWFYDPRVGKWERRTERERIGGTDSNQADFDASRLAEEYKAVYVGASKLGRFSVHELSLTALDGADVAYPTLKVWIDVNTLNVLKRQDFAASGKLMRTAYYPKWQKVHSKQKSSDVWFPNEIRIFDEIEKANRTVVLIKQVDLTPLPANIFTKSWLESKSR